MEQTLKLVLEFVNNATGPLEAAASSAQSVMGGLASGAQRAGGIMGTIWEQTGGRVISALGSMIEKAKLASLIIGGGLVKSVSDLLGMAGDFERFGKAAEYLTGSAQGAHEFAQATRELANATMFNIDQIADLNIRLVGNTKNVKQSKEALMALSEGVAATGGGYAELEAATRAWIQINSKAVASSEELNRQMSNANIPALRILAEHIVRDADSPLRKYIQTATAAGGASSKLTKEYQKASGSLHEYAVRSEVAEHKLENLKNKFGENSDQVKLAQLTVDKYHTALDKAQGTISKYTQAQTKITTTGKSAKLSVEQVMAQLQSLGDLKIPGTIMAAEITKALNEAYGGANKELIKTFSGQLSLLGDVAKQAGLTFLGLDEDFKPVKGGILDLLTQALMPLVSWLQDHQADIQKWAAEWAKSKPLLAALAAFIVGTLASALFYILGPVVLIGAVFGALGAVAEVVIEQLGGFQAVGTGILNIWNAIASTFMSVVVPALQALWNVFGPVFMDAWNRMKPALENLLQAFIKLLPVLGVIAYVLIAALVAALAAVAAVLPFVVNLIALLISAVAGVLTFLGNLAVSIVAFFMNIPIMLSQVGAFFVQVFTVDIPNALLSFVGLVANFITSVNAFFAALPGQISAYVYDLFVVQIPFAIGYMIGWVAFQLPQLLFNMVTWFVLTGARIIGEVATWPSRFQTWINNLINQTIGAIISFGAYLVSLIMGMGTASVNEVSTWPGRIMGFLNALPGLITALLSNMWHSFTSGLERIWNFIVGWKDKVVGAFNAIADAIGHALDLAGKAFSKGVASGAGIGSHAHGGIVNAPLGEPVPIIAHGGERVVPLSGDPGTGGTGGGPTINFYGNMTVDSDERVKQLADQIVRMLGRQNELARYGAGY